MLQPIQPIQQTPKLSPKRSSKHSQRSSRRSKANRLIIDSHIVSLEFRDALFTHFPALKGDLQLQRLVLHALFNPHAHKACDEYTVLSKTDCLRINGYLKTNSRFVGAAFLERACAALPGLSVKPSDHLHNMARGVRLELPQGLRQLFETDLAGSLSSIDHPVDFVTGKSVNLSVRGNHKAARAKHLVELEKRVNSGYMLAELMDYMNGSSVQQHTLLLSKNLTAAYEEASKIASKTKRIRTLVLLRSIERNPLPIYAPSKAGRSQRLYAVGASTQFLTSAVRRILLGVDGGRTVDLDLTNAQLAIVARLWDIQSLREVLEQHASFWEYLGLELRCDPLPIKKALKQFIYGLVFGMKEHAAKHALSSATSSDIATAVFKLEVISDIIRARQACMETLRAGGSLLAGNGEELRLSHIKTNASQQNADIRSLLAQQVQSYEVKLMKAAFDAVKGATEVSILVWQHDGLTLKFARESGRDTWIPRIREAVRLAAEVEKMHTSLGCS